jgi:hypothetical protein
VIFELRVNLSNGLLDEIIEGDVIFPPPVLERGAVIEGAGPCLSDLLSEVRLILDLEVGDAFLH